jgi:hypothetical protein
MNFTSKNHKYQNEVHEWRKNVISKVISQSKVCAKPIENTSTESASFKCHVHYYIDFAWKS